MCRGCLVFAQILADDGLFEEALFPTQAFQLLVSAADRQLCLLGHDMPLMVAALSPRPDLQALYLILHDIIPVEPDGFDLGPVPHLAPNLTELHVVARLAPPQLELLATGLPRLQRFFLEDGCLFSTGQLAAFPELTHLGVGYLMEGSLSPLVSLALSAPQLQALWVDRFFVEPRPITPMSYDAFVQAATHLRYLNITDWEDHRFPPLFHPGVSQWPGERATLQLDATERHRFNIYGQRMVCSHERLGGNVRRLTTSRDRDEAKAQFHRPSIIKPELH